MTTPSPEVRAGAQSTENDGEPYYAPSPHGVAPDYYKVLCSGASDCRSYKHVHGCYADQFGSACDDPEDHDAPGIPSRSSDQ